MENLREVGSLCGVGSLKNSSDARLLTFRLGRGREERVGVERGEAFFEFSRIYFECLVGFSRFRATFHKLGTFKLSRSLRVGNKPLQLL